jgi:hypothetical protein
MSKWIKSYDDMKIVPKCHASSSDEDEEHSRMRGRSYNYL